MARNEVMRTITRILRTVGLAARLNREIGYVLAGVLGFWLANELWVMAGGISVWPSFFALVVFLSFIVSLTFGIGLIIVAGYFVFVPFRYWVQTLWEQAGDPKETHE